MAEKIKKGDFVRVNYTGRLENGNIFDTTVKENAEKARFEGTNDLSPITICVGEGMILRGIDKALENKGMGSFTVDLQPEDAFGKKDAKLLQVIPTPQLQKQGIRPQVGMELNVDGRYGVIKRSGGGRTTVDFNHPLASQAVSYEVEVLEAVTDPEEQIRSIIDMAGLPYRELVVEEKKATIKLDRMLPKPVLDQLNERIKQLTSIETINFEAGKKPENK